MSTGWKAFKLDHLGFVGRGRSRHRPRNDPRLYGGQYPFFQTGDVKAAELYLHSYEATYNETGLAQSKQWDAGTLCITIAANIAESAILSIPGCFPDSVVGFVANPDLADTKFVKYKLDTLKLAMQSASLGTTQDNLSLDKLLRFDFLMPPLPTQRRIATILSAYDDLIENNTRRIAILEEMARRLYQEWFVHFRFPGHEEAEFEGELPKGWQTKEVKDLVKRLKNGTVYKQANVSASGSTMVIDQSRSECLGFHDNAPDHVASVERPLVIFGDHTCKMQVVVTPFSLGPNTIAFAAGANTPLYYLFAIVRGSVETREYKRHWTELMKKRVVVASNDLATRYSQAAMPSFAMSEQLRRMNRNLRAQRDLLLPKLISGEIEVSGLEAELEAAE